MRGGELPWQQGEAAAVDAVDLIWLLPPNRKYEYAELS